MDRRKYYPAWIREITDLYYSARHKYKGLLKKLKNKIIKTHIIYNIVFSKK